MKCNVAFMAMMCLVSFASATNTAPWRKMLDVRYNAQQGTGLLTFTFNHSPSWLDEKVGANQVRLMFPGTAMAQHTSGIPLRSENGFIKSVSFGPPHKDTLALTITFQEGVVYDICQMQNQSQIVMEMHCADTTKPLATVIDIKSIARQQMEDENSRQKLYPTTPSMKENQASVSDLSVGIPVEIHGVQTIPLALSLVSSLFLTTVMLFWRLYGKRTASQITAGAVLPAKNMNPAVNNLLAQAQLILKEKTEAIATNLVFERRYGERENSSAKLPRTSMREQSELRLARAFSTRQHTWEKKRHLLDAQTPGPDSIATARKLGVGTGEMNLARVVEAHAGRTQKTGANCMIKGLYSSSNGMPPMLVRMEVISNNLANINTSGFKRDSLFVEMMKDPGIAPNANAGELANRLTAERVTDFTEGSLNKTSNPLDVALQGDGYFVVQTPQGERYTRCGNFTLALDGTLTSNEGFPVMGEQGKITFPDLQKVSQGDIVITKSGEISLDKNLIGQLRVVEFADQAKLHSTGSAMFEINDNADPGMKQQDMPTVCQGFLEESNVDGIAEMMEMIELTRSFESNQKAISSQDATLEKAFEVGKF